MFRPAGRVRATLPCPSPTTPTVWLLPPTCFLHGQHAVCVSQLLMRLKVCVPVVEPERLAAPTPQVLQTGFGEDGPAGHCLCWRTSPGRPHQPPPQPHQGPRDQGVAETTAGAASSGDPEEVRGREVQAGPPAAQGGIARGSKCKSVFCKRSSESLKCGREVHSTDVGGRAGLQGPSWAMAVRGHPDEVSLF